MMLLANAALFLGGCSRTASSETPGAKNEPTTNRAVSAIRPANIIGEWAAQGTSSGIKSVFEYRKDGDFVGTIVQNGMPIILLGKWVITNNAIMQHSTSLLSAEGHLNPVENETNTIVSWDANQITFVGTAAGMTCSVVRVNKESYLGKNAASDSRTLEGRLRRSSHSKN